MHRDEGNTIRQTLLTILKLHYQKYSGATKTGSTSCKQRKLDKKQEKNQITNEEQIKQIRQQ